MNVASSGVEMGNPGLTLLVGIFVVAIIGAGYGLYRRFKPGNKG
jgi:hypothetical protein